MQKRFIDTFLQDLKNLAMLIVLRAALRLDRLHGCWK